MIDPPAVEPAPLRLREDGVPYSERFQDVYFSAAGGLAETRHTFLLGNGLPERWTRAERFTIIECGFGTGLNFLATWQAWRSSAPAAARLHYVAVEKHPLSRADLERAAASWSELAVLSATLREVYPPAVPGFHRLHFDCDRVALTLLFGDAATMLAQLDARADAFFLDGFAPSKNPEMWTRALFRQLARLAATGATLATYSVAGEVRRALAEAGFSVTKRAGFGCKREMLTGVFAGVGQAERSGSRQRHVAVIGAGLAGTSCAGRLAARGFSVDLVERHPAPACEASANPAGIFHPALLADRRTRSTFTTAASLYAVRQLEALDRSPSPARWMASGVLQVCRDPRRLERLVQASEQIGAPEGVARRVSREEGSALVGAHTGGAGFWFEVAGWASAASVCEARLARCGDSVRRVFAREAIGLDRVTEGWRVLDAGGSVIAEAPAVVLANARDAPRFAVAGALRLRAVRGQITRLPARQDGGLRAAVCGDGYVVPALDGMHCIGASFDEDDSGTDLRGADHVRNLERLERMLPGFGAPGEAASLAGWVGVRAVTPDHLPRVGALDGDEGVGVFVCVGLGARGLTWSALLGEILASHLDGDALPVPRHLTERLAPGETLTQMHIA
ncbi:MAG: bifunctional tRNA (5-methylaminomethyl-2-thiouridine)(34)-methyltransferase MnmD/FAD-dependent 5-carboxymethylaminomethyl-2-thiouridine(34) oxidoreductase MnmC [Burkholderiales bacterium]